MATNGEDMVPGLGKKQATVLNNEEGRRTEHKRHLEELGFPKEVDAAFMRYAPVSYDDENPMPSKVVNQAGEDLGFTPKDSLMKSDIQSIVKEAAQEVFISKQPEEQEGIVSDEVLERMQANLKRFFTEAATNTRDSFKNAYYSSLQAGGGKGLSDEFSKPLLGTDSKYAVGPLSSQSIWNPVNMAETLVGGFGGLLFDSKSGTEIYNVKGKNLKRFANQAGYEGTLTENTLFAAVNAAGGIGNYNKLSGAQKNKLLTGAASTIKDATENTLKDMADSKEGKELGEVFEVDLQATDPAGVPLISQPGGLVAGKYKSGKGQTKDQSMEPIDYDPKKETDAIGMPRQFEPGASGPTRRGEVQQFVPGPGQTKDQVTPPGGKFGSIGARQIKVEAGTGANKGKLVGTISGSGTNPYRISLDPSEYGGVKAGDTINYNPSKDPVGAPRVYQVSSVTDAGKPVKREFTKPGLTFAEAQARVAANYKGPPVKKVGGTYYEASMQKSMQKYQAWLQKAEDEGAMAKVQLDRVSDLADMMHDVLDENDELPGWIQNKISDSLHNLEASFTHLAYDAKQEMELAKSKEAFQDFLAKAPQSGGTLLKNEIYLQKAVPILAPLLGLLGRVLGVGAAKKLISGGFRQGAKKTLKNADVAKKAGLLGTLKGGLKWFGVAAVGDEILEQAGLVDDPGYIDIGKYYNKVQEMASANPDAGNMMADSGNTINQEISNWATNTKDSLRDGLDSSQQKIFDNAYNNPAQALPNVSTPTVHQAPPEFKSAGWVEPIYDTSPEAEARVRSGGSESIIGANVNGQKYRFKAPIKNMGGVNQALHRATPDSSL